MFPPQWRNPRFSCQNVASFCAPSPPPHMCFYSELLLGFHVSLRRGTCCSVAAGPTAGQAHSRQLSWASAYLTFLALEVCPLQGPVLGCKPTECKVYFWCITCDLVLLISEKAQSSKETLSQWSYQNLPLDQPYTTAGLLPDRWAVVVGLEQGPRKSGPNSFLPRGPGPGWWLPPELCGAEHLCPRAQRGSWLEATTLKVKEWSPWSIFLFILHTNNLFKKTLLM